MCKPNSVFLPGITLLHAIHSNKSSILIVKCLSDSKYYVLKVFPNDEVSKEHYLREKNLLSSLGQSNVIKYVPNKLLFKNELSIHQNIISMEYAPYGDFFNLILDYGITDEKLIRTYFHQLIQGLEYLHSRQIAHLDLKLENLLLGEDFLLKIADFDLAQEIDDNKSSVISSGGTANYRPPEILSGNCTDYIAADIYSAGVCLYTLMTGSFPFIEETDGDKVKLFRYKMFSEENGKFWMENEELMEGKVIFSQDFKELLNKMLCKDPSKRITLEEIKQSNWYREAIYTQEELKIEMKKILKQ